MMAASSSTSGLIVPATLDVTRIERRDLLTHRAEAAAAALGTTRWASPPPGVSWRAIALVVLLGDLGLLLLALDLGLLSP